MADGKNIELKIAATGGDQAAAEFKKAADGAKQLTNNPNTSTGFGGMLEQGEKVREAREKANAERLVQIEAEKAAIDELARVEKKALDDEIAGMRQKEQAAKANAERLNEEATDRKAAGRKKEIAGAVSAIGIAAGLAAKAISNVYAELEAVDTQELKTVDAAFAEQIENAKKFKEALADPIGALAALANGGTTVKEAFAGMAEQITLNTDAYQAQIDRMIAKAGVNVGEIKKLADDLKAANDLLSAKDELAAINREAESEEAVRNGADPDDEAAKLAKAAAADKIADIERRQEEVRREESPQAFFDSANASRAEAARIKSESEKKLADADTEVKRRAKEGSEINPVLSPFKFAAATSKFRDARANRDAIRGDKTDDEAIKAAEAQAAASQKAFEAAQKKVRESDELAAVEKQKIRAGLNRTVSGFEARKGDRFKAEESRREDARFEARENFQDFQDYRRKGQQRDDLEGREESLDNSARERGLAIRGFGERRDNETASNVGKALADGTNAAEIQKLGDQVAEAAGKNGQAMTAALQKVLQTLGAQSKEIETLRQQIRNK